MHAYIDETDRPGHYIVTAVVIAATHGGRMRSALRSLARDLGRGRLHFHDLTPQQKLKALAAFGEMEITAYPVECPTSVGTTRARQLCIATQVAQLHEVGVSTLVIESGGNVTSDGRDRQTIANTLSRDRIRLEYRHDLPRQEPLLWLPDGIGWALARGRRGRNAGYFEKVDHVTERVHKIDP